MRRVLLLALLAVAVLLAAVSCSKQLPTQVARTGPERTIGSSTAMCLLCIGDFVWSDLNGNGIQDAGEPGVPDVVLDLYGEDGHWIRSTTTDANGHYDFCDLGPGKYKVGLKPPCDLTITHAGGDRTKDSNENPSSVTLTDAEDPTIDFGVRCGGPKPECAKCEGKVNSLTLRYEGTVGAVLKIVQKKPKATLFSDFVNPADEISIAGADKKGTFGSDLIVYVNGVQRTKIHTSCSKPIGPGMKYGDLLVVAGTSLKGGPLCPAPPPDGGQLCENGRPRALVLSYTGEDCSASSHAQAEGKVVCSGDPNMASPVRIIITDSITEGAGNVFFQGDVAVDGSLTMDAANAGQTRLATNSYAYLYSGGTLVQKIQFHTSCSQPLRVGDQYGSLLVTGFIPAAVVTIADER